MKYLQLIRYKNLFIVIATMLVVRYALLAQFMPLQLSTTGFILLVVATVCITAAGYVINDYFDVNADMMNKPEKVIVGSSISRRSAMILHWTLNVIGCICGALVAFGIAQPTYSFVFIFICGILWFYSTTFSKEPIVGNVVVALLVATVPLITVLFEMLPLLSFPIDELRPMHIQFEEILLWSFGYTLFAFLLTLEREMVKDIEDMEGDRTYGRNTLPIAYGLKTARHTTMAVGFVTLCSFIYAQICKLNDVVSVLFLSALVTIPLIYVLVALAKADSSQDYARISLCLKLVMVMGLAYLILIRCI